MTEKVGRNDPCPCGSGKKYKSCCLLKQEQARTSMGKRKFTAKVLSSGSNKIPQVGEEQTQATKPVDYATLMERSFGQSLHSHEEKPPIPSNPAEYLSKEDGSDEHLKSEEK